MSSAKKSETDHMGIAKTRFLDVYNSLPEEYRCRFARWVGGFAEGEIDSLAPTQTEETLIQIADTLRMDIEPPGGKLPNLDHILYTIIYRCTQLKF